MKYFYRGLEVQLVPGQQFNTHWNVYYPEPTESGGSIRRIVSVQPGKDLELREDDTKETKQSLPDSLTVLTVEPTVPAININKADFNTLKSKLSGVGRSALRSIITNRPAEGYKDFKQVMDLNSGVQAQWEIIEPLVKFEG